MSAKTAPGANQSIPAGGGQKMLLLRIAQVLFTIALAISVYLAYTSLSSGQVAGCGEGSNCDEVLTSRWAYWFGLPVSLPAALFYSVMLGASAFAGPGRSVLVQKRAWMILVAGAFVVLAAAMWFIGLQAAILKSWCTWCLRAHLAGSLGAALVLVAAPFVIRSGGQSPFLFGVQQRAWAALIGMLSLFPLVVGQYLSKAPGASIVETAKSTMQVEAPTQASATNLASTPVMASTNVAEPATTETPVVTSTNSPPQRLFTLHDRIRFDLYNVPVIGNPGAPHVMVSLYDYTCPHCRDLHKRLVRVRELYPDELAIIAMPMPLDADCNPLIQTTAAGHQNACEYARTALAVFLEKKDRFAEFDDWLFASATPRPLDDTRALAQEWTEAADLEASMLHPSIDGWIKLSAQVFQLTSNQSGQRSLPMLLAGNVVLSGRVSSDQELIDYLVSSLGLPAREIDVADQ